MADRNVCPAGEEGSGVVGGELEDEGGFLGAEFVEGLVERSEAALFGWIGLVEEGEQALFEEVEAFEVDGI